MSDARSYGAHCSKAPHDPSRRAVIVLRVTGLVRMHIVALYAPGEVLEEELVVRAPAHVDHHRAPNKSAGIQAANPAHNLEERAPPAGIGEQTRASHCLVLGNALAIEAAGVDRNSEVLKTRERQ